MLLLNILIISILIILFVSNFKNKKLKIPTWKYETEAEMLGKIGEKNVNIILNFLPKEYRVFTDIYLEINEITTQIDHLIISNYGIFVIETKNYSGWIYGGDSSEYWTQNMYGKKYKFYNPIKQNLAHTNVLESILKIHKSKFVPIVVFAGDAELKINSRNIVIHLLELEKFILNCKTKILTNSEIDEITQKLRASIILDENIEDKHIQNIKTRLRQKMINHGVCPKCKTKLVEKNGRYGKFIGCNNFPKCKFILKKQDVI